MTKRDFALIADMISELERLKPETKNRIANQFADKLKIQFPHFDRKKFMGYFQHRLDLLG